MIFVIQLRFNRHKIASIRSKFPHFFVVKVDDANGAEHGEDYEEMKQVILDSLFTSYLGETIRK